MGHQPPNSISERRGFLVLIHSLKNTVIQKSDFYKGEFFVSYPFRSILTQKTVIHVLYIFFLSLSYVHIMCRFCNTLSICLFEVHQRYTLPNYYIESFMYQI